MNDGGTRRDGADRGDNQRTRRDNGEGVAGGSQPSYSRANLPPELAERYTVIRDLPSGGEGAVLLVEDGGGTRFVVKWYRANLSFDDDASALLAEADPAHVVRVIESGESAHDGSRFEVLEYCEFGTLADLLREGRQMDISVLVTELATALEHIHGLRIDGLPDRTLIHRDLKPDNVLVRTLEPLDLVLGDFGLARMIAGTRHLTEREQGSRPWAPPSGEALTVGWDWWALGMVVAEVAGKRHPFAVDGALPGDAAIADLLSQGPVDLSAVEDDRLRTLCRGLLTRRTGDRWGASEVQRWLAGDDVDVATDLGGIPTRDRVVVFAESEYRDPVSLAAALQDRWDQAQEELIQRTDGGHLAQQVIPMLSSYGLSDAVALLGDNLSSPPIRLVNLLVEMDPDLHPRFRGRDIRPLAIATRLTDHATSESEVQLIERPGDGLLATNVLRTWQHLEGMDGASDAHQQLAATSDALRAHTARLDALPGGGKTAAKAMAYRLALTPDDEPTMRAALAQLDRTAAERASWWAELARAEDTTSLVLALTSHAAAEEEIAEEDARLGAERATDERRRREQEAERRAQEAQARRVVTARRWRRWWIPLFFFGLVGLWIGIGTFAFPAGDPDFLLRQPFDWGWGLSTLEWRAESLDDLGAAFDWNQLEPGGGESMALGCVALFAGLTSLSLAIAARSGRGIAGTGHLRGSVSFLRGLSITTILGLGFVLAPWTVAGLSMLAIGIGYALLAVLGIFIAIAVFAVLLSN